MAWSEFHSFNAPSKKNEIQIINNRKKIWEIHVSVYFSDVRKWIKLGRAFEIFKNSISESCI